MDKTLEMTLAIISAVFVLYTAMIDPMAALSVALVAIVCFVAYKMIFGKKAVKVVPVKKVAAKKTAAKKVAKTKKK